jgi:23S rRNA pseudouridine2605 synthase
MAERETLRISQFLARCGVASRRAAEELVRAGRVSVNGVAATDLGRQIRPGEDQVTVDGRPVRLAETPLTIALNKPTGCMTTRRDPEGRRTVYDLLRGEAAARASELVYAGRLDWDTSGLLIMSTDGALINNLTHPSRHVVKTYEATTACTLSQDALHALREGVDIGDHHTAPAQVRLLRPGYPPLYEIRIGEGRNRQVRRMVEAVGGRVLALRRTAIGALRLETLKLQEGDCRALDENQIARLLTDDAAPR